MKKIITTASFIAAFCTFTAKAQMAMPEAETLSQYTRSNNFQRLNPGSVATQIDTQGKATVSKSEQADPATNVSTNTNSESRTNKNAGKPTRRGRKNINEKQTN